MSSYSRSEAPGDYGYTAAATAKPRRRRVVNCVGPDEDATVETFYADESKSNDPLRFTTCMSHHIMARIEDDVKRAKMRETNPESAIPSRGYDYDQEASRAVEEYRTTQQLPRSSNVVAATLYSPARNDFVLPSISPTVNRSRRGSALNSRQPSQGNSTSNSPSSRSRRAAPKQTSARRPSRQPRTPSRSSQYPSAYHSRSSSRHQQSRTNNESLSVSNSASPQPRLPAGGRLQPLGQATPSTTSPQQGGYRDDGRVVAYSGRHPKTGKKLSLEPASLEEEEEEENAIVTRGDAERQRRLRLAEELALQMDAESF